MTTIGSELEKLFYVQCVVQGIVMWGWKGESVWGLEVLSGEKRKWRGGSKKASIKLTISLARCANRQPVLNWQ